MFELDSIDRDELATRLEANKQEALTIGSRVDEAEKALDSLRSARDNDRAGAEFIRDRGEAIEKMLDQLEHLAPADKKRGIESVHDGPVMVRWETDWVEDGEEPRIGIGWKCRFNKEIFDSLIRDGKISPIPSAGKSCDTDMIQSGAKNNGPDSCLWKQLAPR